MARWSRLIRFVWRRVGDISNLQFLLPALWWGWLVSTLVGMAAAVGGLIRGIPAYLWIPLAAFAFLAVSVAINVWRWRAAPPTGVARSGHDMVAKQVAAEEWTYWCNTDEMALWQAAYLWTETLPPDRRPAELPPLVRVQAERLERATKRGQLASKAVFNDDAHPALQLLDRYVGSSEYAQVERGALCAYAETTSDRPSFLYSNR